MLGLVIMIALAVVFYRMADFEDLPAPMLWALASMLLYLGFGTLLPWGICSAMGGQVLLGVVMTIFIARQRGG